MPKSSDLNQPSNDGPAGVFLPLPPASKPSIWVKSSLPEEGDILWGFLNFNLYIQNRRGTLHPSLNIWEEYSLMYSLIESLLTHSITYFRIWKKVRDNNPLFQIWIDWGAASFTEKSSSPIGEGEGRAGVCCVPALCIQLVRRSAAVARHTHYGFSRKQDALGAIRYVLRTRMRMDR